MTNDFTKYGFIFDMDGTLVDNMRFHMRAWTAMLAENEIENDGQDFLIKTAGKTNREIIPQYFENASEEELVQLGNRKEEIYRELFKPELQAVDGVIELFFIYILNFFLPAAKALAVAAILLKLLLDIYNFTKF